MSYKQKNIENYLYFADSEALDASNDDDKVVMWPTSGILALFPVTQDSITTHFREADGSWAYDSVDIKMVNTAPTMKQWREALDIYVSHCQKNHKEGMVSIVDCQEPSVCHQVFTSAAGTVTISTQAV